MNKSYRCVDDWQQLLVRLYVSVAVNLVDEFDIGRPIRVVVDYRSVAIALLLLLHFDVSIDNYFFE
jgi:hypothetical protein